ncbi:MAG: four helix bundle protein [Chlorobi bacterium]|nr:four helix bundle protein [Chlorobiota bacterium]
MNNFYNKEQEILIRKSFVFTLDIIHYAQLLEEKKKNFIAKQLLVFGTAFGENMHNLQFIKSERSYLDKLEKAKKHAQKTKYWLQLCKYSNEYPKPNGLLTEVGELIETISLSSYQVNKN